MRSTCVLLVLVTVLQNVHTKIENSVLVNKIQSDIMKPVGKVAKFQPVAEPTVAPSGRRHIDIDQICNKRAETERIHDTPNVVIVGDYYDELGEKDTIKVRMPHHIDKHHYEVTTSEPYYTVGLIRALGYNPPTHEMDSCERLYHEHLGEQYSDESADVSQESLEMIRIPVPRVQHEKLNGRYGDYK